MPIRCVCTEPGKYNEELHECLHSRAGSELDLSGGYAATRKYEVFSSGAMDKRRTTIFTRERGGSCAHKNHIGMYGM